MRTLVVRFFAAEDGAPAEGGASLLAGRWRTAVDARRKPVHAAQEVRFEVGDSTVVNEALVSGFRRFQRFVPWPKSDVLEVRLEKSTELILAANHDSDRFVKVCATGGQDVTDFLQSLGKNFHVLRAGQSLNCSQLLPGLYRIDVFDDAQQPIAQFAVDLTAWRTRFVEVP
jgi:hypothetical protein